MNNIQSLLFRYLRNALWHNEEGLPKELTEKDFLANVNFRITA